MSLNQKYTWANFLKENPELKAKGVKRTSAEGKKAFEAAFKAKVKDVLKDRLEKIEKDKKRVTANRDTLIGKMKAAKKKPAKKKLQVKVGAKDKYISKLGKMTERTKTLQKNV